MIRKLGIHSVPAGLTPLAGEGPVTLSATDRSHEPTWSRPPRWVAPQTRSTPQPSSLLALRAGQVAIERPPAGPAPALPVVEAVTAASDEGEHNLRERPLGWATWAPEVQAAAAAAYRGSPELAAQVRAAFVRHLADAYYDSTLQKLYRETPEVIRRDPAFVEAIIRRVPGWSRIDFGEARAAVEACLGSVAFLAAPETPLAAIGVGVAWGVLDGVRLGANALVAAVAGKVANGASYQSLPEALRRDATVTAAALSADPRALAHVPLDDAPAPLRAVVEAHVLRALQKGELAWPKVPSALLVPPFAARAREVAIAAAVAALGAESLRWSAIPAELRAQPALIAKALTARPALVAALSEGELDHARPLFADRAWVMRALDHLPTFAQHLPSEFLADPAVIDAAARAVAQNLSVAQRLPASLRAHPQVVAAVAQHRGGRTDPYHLIPEGALTPEALTLIIAAGPQFLRPDQPLRGALLGQAVARAKEVMAAGVELAAMPQVLRERVELQRALLETQGPKAVRAQLGEEALFEAQLWKGASAPRAIELATVCPAAFAALPLRLRGSPPVVLEALAAAEPRFHGLILAQVPPSLLQDAAFADPMLAVSPATFRFLPESLRADPERARRALLASSANIGAENLEPPARQALLDAVAQASSQADGPWSHDAERAILHRAAQGHANPGLLLGKTLALAAMAAGHRAAEQIEPHLLLDPVFLQEVADRAPKALAYLPLAALAPQARAQVLDQLRDLAERRPAIFAHLPRVLRADRALQERLLPQAPSLVEGESDPAWWVLAATTDARVLDRATSTVEAHLKGEPWATTLRDAAIAQLRAGSLPPPPFLPKALIHGPHQAAILAVAVEVYGGAALRGLSDGWFDNRWMRALVRQAILADPVATARGLDRLPVGIRDVLGELATAQPPAAVAFAATLAQNADVFGSLPKALQVEPKVFSAALEGGSGAGGVRGWRNLLASLEQAADVELVAGRGRVWRSEAGVEAFAQQLSAALAEARAQGVTELWPVYPSGVPGMKCELRRARVRGADLVVDDPPFPRRFPLADMALVQLGGPAPQGPTSSEALYSREQTDDARWVAEVQTRVAQARGNPRATVFFKDEAYQKLGPIAPEVVEIDPHGILTAVTTAGAPVRLDLNRAKGMSVLTSPPNPLLEASQARRGSPTEVPERAAQAQALLAEVIQRHPEAIHDLTATEQTPALWRVAAARSPAVYRRAPAEVRADREVTRRVLILDGSALQHADDTLKADPALVALAMRAYPKAWTLAQPPLALPGPQDERRQQLLDLDLPSQASVLDQAAALAAQLVGERGSPRRELYLEYVRRVGLPAGDHPLLADPEVALAAAANGDQLKGHWDYVRPRLRRDPAFVDAFVQAAPGWLRSLPPECVRPEHVAAVAAHPSYTFLLQRTQSFYDPVPPGVTADLDPRTGVPPECWADIAAAHPKEFLERFKLEQIPAEHHPALKRAYLAAVRRDHRELRYLAPQLRAELPFLAACVRVNPQVLGELAPAQVALLEATAPAEVARGRALLDQLAEAQLGAPERFEGRFDILARLLEDRFAPSDDPRPLAVVVFPHDDYNGAFTHLAQSLPALFEHYRVAYADAGDVETLGRSIRAATHAKPADLVLLGGHGTRTSLQLGPNRRSEHSLRVDDLGLLRALGLHDRVTPGGQVALFSCSSGRGEDRVRNTVNMLSDLWPQATVRGQTQDSANRLEVDASGRFVGIDYSLKGRYVPPYVISPRI